MLNYSMDGLTYQEYVLYIHTYMYVPASLSLLRVCRLTTLLLALPISVAFCDNSEHHVSEEKRLSQELSDIKQKERQMKLEKERAFPQTTLERCNAQGAKEDFSESLKMSQHNEHAGSPNLHPGCCNRCKQ